jgi:hypothetical protein
MAQTPGGPGDAPLVLEPFSVSIGPSMIRVAHIAFSILMIPAPSLAQGLPVNTGPQAPVWVWFAGVVLLGLVMAYAIMRNRKRSRGEKNLTDAATKANYANEDRAAKSSGID